MRIRKVLDTSIDLTNPSDIYQHDKNALLIKKLNARYQNKCFKSILILNVDKIIRSSPIMLNDNQLNGSAYIDVQFEVEGIILIKDEVLNNCTVTEIHNNAIIAKHEYASILLKSNINDKISKILSPKQKIPIIVERVKYIPEQSTISMIGVPFIPSSTPTRYFNIIERVLPDESDKINTILQEIDKEEKEHKNLSITKQYKFFQELLYPFKVNQKYLLSPFAKQNNFTEVKLDLSKILSIEKGIIAYPDEIHKKHKIFVHSKNFNMSQPDISIINIRAYPLFASICNKYLLYLQALRGFVDTYKTPKDMSPLMTYWKLCQNAKK